MTKTFLLATVAFLGLVSASNAAVIATFSQTSSTNTVVATDNSVTTNIVVDDAVTNISTFGGGGPIAGAFFSLNSTSNDAAVQVGGAVIQHYDGNFCFSSAINCGGTNYLSGVFSDAAFGALGGPGLVVNVNNPPDSLILTSDIIAPADLQPPSSFSLAFTNLTPVLAIDGATINGFTAAFAGVVSASTVTTPVPEPASLGILGLGLLGLGMIRARKAN